LVNNNNTGSRVYQLYIEVTWRTDIQFWKLFNVQLWETSSFWDVWLLVSWKIWTHVEIWDYQGNLVILLRKKIFEIGDTSKISSAFNLLMTFHLIFHFCMQFPNNCDTIEGSEIKKGMSIFHIDDVKTC